MSKIEVNTVDVQCGSTLTLGSSGKTVTLACGASQSGFGRTGTVNWCTTAKTGPLTVESGKGYFINTTSGEITVTLPSSPSAGDIVALKDYASTWQTNNVIVGRNGSKINGSCHDATLVTEAQSVTLIYVDGTKGWQDVNDSTADITGSPNFVNATGGTVLTVGNFKTHVFTGSGTFEVIGGGKPSGSTKVDYFVVAGGGGGGAAAYSGGGGAGGFRLSNCAGCLAAPTMSPLVNACGAITASVGSFPITIGAGGTKSPTGPVAATAGSSSTFSTITSAGGGRGFSSRTTPGSGATDPLTAGGSGGGSDSDSPGPSPNRGTGNSPPVAPPQGNNGGDSGPGSPWASGGGGAGGGGSPGAPGSGGIGSFISDSFLGPTAPSYGTPGPASSVRYFAGGGGGGQNANYPFPGTVAAGGAGGGGTGGVPGFTGAPPNPAAPAGINGGDGTVNTGGGGGGGGYNSSPNNQSGGGGSGVVMIRYKFQ